jgi:hypothetical protein
MRTKLGHINRFVAVILALGWAGAGVAGLVAAYVTGRWLERDLPALPIHARRAKHE